MQGYQRLAGGVSGHSQAADLIIFLERKGRREIQPGCPLAHRRSTEKRAFDGGYRRTDPEKPPLAELDCAVPTHTHTSARGAPHSVDRMGMALAVGSKHEAENVRTRLCQRARLRHWPL
ncbi:hypothetical protein CUR178_04888 [Leishmania enriettii]|uniref:Uncharacterized protein n=1 Tax=Leishmania enriettii TaxID=5663 RepID=A0A836KPN1_LEIEN|nr:hypothetical protein CUR178_04888 [Leishmania enriettii]